MKKSIIFFAYLFLSYNLSKAQNITLKPSNGTDLEIIDYNGTPSIIGKRANGGSAAPVAAPNGTFLLTIKAIGFNGSSFDSNPAASINFNASQTHSVTANGGEINFNTTLNGNLVPSTRMRLANNGFLGIGTDGLIDPRTKLHVSNGSSGITPTSNTTTAFFENENNNYVNIASPNNTESGLIFGRPSGGQFSGGIIYDANRSLVFRTGSNISKMFITSAGKVGIGTSAPNYTLDIVENTGNNSVIKLNNATSGLLGSDGAYISSDSDGDLTLANFEEANIDITTGAGSIFLQPDGKVSIGNSFATNSKLEVNGDFVLNRVTTNTVNGGYADLNRNGASILKFTNGGILRGIAGGVEGMILYVYNTSTTALTINNQDAASASFNRIITPNNTNFNLGSSGGATLIYDNGTLRWRVVSIAQ